VKELREWVGEQLGAIAKPDDIRFADNLPKTRSGKIMRRLLKAIARGEEITQDVSTLENPGILEQLRGTQSPRAAPGGARKPAPAGKRRKPARAARAKARATPRSAARRSAPRKKSPATGRKAAARRSAGAGPARRRRAASGGRRRAPAKRGR
jgi:hypothetical protein